MEPTEKKLYWEKVDSKKGESIKPKSIADMKNAMENIFQDRKSQEKQSKEREEKRRLFMENRANEILTYRKRIAEAATLDELNQVKAEILNRISLVKDENIGDYPKVKQTFKGLKILLKYVDAEITAFKPETKEPENKFLNIFKEGGYELFWYLNENYTRHDKQLPTKYSNLYRFLDYEQFIVGTQDQYKDFIKGKFGIKFSKVTKGNYTYTDNVSNLLTRLKSQYKNQLKST